MTDPDPGLPATRTADRFDVFLCSPRAAPDDEAAERIEEALLAAGLRVFRPGLIDDFDKITGEIADAIAGSRVLLACYSRLLPTRYACQWELTAAFAAARRHGDPADRVLVLNPESGTAHVAPAELAATRFFTGPVTAANLPDLVAKVRRKVAATDGPLGAPTGRPVPGRPVGRYPALWSVHSALFPGSTTGARPMVVVHGLPGVGKTVLAERYAALFDDAFPGGVIRTGPFGHHDPDDFLAQFHLGLARAVADQLGTDVSGLDLDRLRALLADRIAAAREKVLVLVDDVPAGLPPAVLDRLVLPSDHVRTLVTGRAGPWAAATVELTGLTPEEGVRLFSEFREPVDDVERTAVLRFADRCDGHPITLRATAFTVRHRSRAVTGEVLDALPDTAPQAVRDLLAVLGGRARELVRLGTVLAPVPIPLALATEVLGGIEDATAELVTRGLATENAGDLRFQALTLEVARTDPAPGDLPARAAEVLLGWLADGRGPRDFLLQHARVVAESAPAHRVRLLRPIAATYEAQGDPATAGEVHAVLLSTGEGTSADYTAAGRVEIACGLYAEAIGHAREALALADGDAELHAAGLTAAQALDCQGDYAEADRTFWRPMGDRLPEDGEERYRFAAAAARAHRLRGRPRDAVALLEPVLAEVRDAPGDLRLEYARSLQLTGQPRRAREVAGEVVTAHHAAGRDRHARCTEAELVRADAMLALDLADLRAAPADWERSAAALRELAEGYARRYGTENPLTLTATGIADRALLALGQPKRALAVLSATEQVVLRVLGGDHPLRYRIRHGMGLAHGQLREFGRQAELLEGVLEPQIRLLGRTHPETLETRLDLGIALALSDGPRRRATELVDGAARDVADAPGVSTELAAKAQAAKQVVRLPQPFVSALFTVERVIWPGRADVS
ncbi:toll/interleukin-1 receptor domain-containing protein [Amycolatopsis sp., V23-08]|uniref:Toll/interleukin-1 receptor domain-containing protein n=1 Tax=Amycolatopsis heterodermiae TaxID=3110235 RepID=A0ABU5QWB1_9PSEU|nr:toll/interleukin-1 receptor domain-containing protein [Amycolatopsis sp., V23-08]MEA5357914.1 toll/interleukin-1 receptor domain-containing protein [Amycolatopsis sp., V23-08]